MAFFTEKRTHGASHVKSANQEKNKNDHYKEGPDNGPFLFYCLVLIVGGFTVPPLAKTRFFSFSLSSIMAESFFPTSSNSSTNFCFRSAGDLRILRNSARALVSSLIKRRRFSTYSLVIR